MKFRIISSKNEILDLNQNERMVHLAFRPSNMDFVNLMNRCPRLRAIQIPPSYNKTVSKAVIPFLEMQGIELLEGDVWGHRKDIDEYYVIDLTTLEEIDALISKGVNIKETVVQIQAKSRLPPDLIKYIAKAKITT